jgi:long-chain fatty acid transport protein
MKKLLMLIVATSLTGTVLAGGLVTNTNQSALFTRLQSRNASTSMDASYYNPAGMTLFNDGFFASISNQTIGQTRTITSNYKYLSGAPEPFQPFYKTYDGSVSAPLFPSVYAGYKMGKFAVSVGLAPVGGGGGASYANGLPSFEMQIADLVPKLNASGIPTSKYAADIFFEGTSVYFGYHANAAYQLNDVISVSAGIRFVTAKNTYSGYIRNISINPNYPMFGPEYTGGMVLAQDFFNSGATRVGALAGGATSYSTALTGMFGMGVDPNTLLIDGESVGLSTTDIATISLIMGAAGVPPNATTTLGQSNGVLTASAPVFGNQAIALGNSAAQAADKEVDVEQTGTGITPIFGINFKLSDKLNLAVKYEMQTSLDLITKVYDNKGAGIFIDGDTTIADMPALLGMGFEYKPNEKLLFTGSMNLYFDNNVDYDGSSDVNVNMIEKNFTEWGFGAEYTVNDKLRASIGWLGTFTGVNDNYNSDQRYSANTNTFGGGFGYRISPMIDINIGGSYTVYDTADKMFNRVPVATAVPIYETYDKGTWIFGIGADFFFGK